VSVHSYRDGRGRIRWRVNINLPPGPDGKRRSTTKRGFPTKREARSWEDGVRGRVAAGDIPATNTTRTTVAGYLRGWYVGVGGKETTRAHYRDMCEWYLIPALGGVPLAQLSAEHVDALYRTLEREGGRRSQGLSAKTVRLVHVVLHRALSVAVERGYVPMNVAGLAHPPSQKAARSRGAERVWTAEQTGRWLAWLEQRQDRLWPVWRLIATTGMRRGEACGLHWQDVDLDGGAVRVRWELTVVDGVPTWVDGAKTPHGERTLELDSGTVLALRAHRARQLEERLAAGAAYRDEGLVVCWEDGRLMHPDRLLRALHRHADALGFPRIGVHGLRHSYATLWLQSGERPDVLKERLGHASISTTVDVYGHVTREDHRSAAEQAARRITG
jgi:integrase